MGGLIVYGIEDKKFYSTSEFYNYFNKKLNDLIKDEPDALANLANVASLMGVLIERINWAGFYIFKNNELVLGPFWGKPACTHIMMGEGVCGTAARTKEIQIVEDVNNFPGHITCDIASKSEIVIPIIKNKELQAVLDIDSPEYARFNQEDAEGLKKTVEVLAKLNWKQLR